MRLPGEPCNNCGVNEAKGRDWMVTFRSYE